MDFSGLSLSGGVSFRTVGFDPYWGAVTLLLQGQGSNGSTTISDSSPITKTMTRSGVTISTAQYIYGTSSIYVAGTGNYCYSLDESVFNVGSGNWTFETWVRLTDTTVTQNIIWLGGVPSANAIGALRLDVSNGGTTGTVRMLIGNASGSAWTSTNNWTTTALANNTWYHLAVVRNGTSIKMYVNGTAEISITVSAGLTLYPGSGLGYTWIGSKNSNTSGGITVTSPITGYVEDVRVTVGIARYTANFTVPSALFPTF